MRDCARCSASFTPAKGHPHQQYCSTLCRQTASWARWNARNPGAARESRRAYDKVRAKLPARKIAARIMIKSWDARNVERRRLLTRLNQSKRRALKGTGRVRPAEWLEQLEVFGHRCAYCLCKLDAPVMEHVTALARGGEHSIDNIVPSCTSCNGFKHARGPLAMLNRPIAA